MAWHGANDWLNDRTLKAVKCDGVYFKMCSLFLAAKWMPEMALLHLKRVFMWPYLTNPAHVSSVLCVVQYVTNLNIPSYITFGHSLNSIKPDVFCVIKEKNSLSLMTYILYVLLKYILYLDNFDIRVWYGEIKTAITCWR